MILTHLVMFKFFSGAGGGATVVADWLTRARRRGRR